MDPTTLTIDQRLPGRDAAGPLGSDGRGVRAAADGGPLDPRAPRRPRGSGPAPLESGRRQACGPARRPSGCNTVAAVSSSYHPKIRHPRQPEAFMVLWEGAGKKKHPITV